MYALWLPIGASVAQTQWLCLGTVASFHLIIFVLLALALLLSLYVADRIG